MGYADIENKSCDELKADRDALMEMAEAEPSEVIAARYIKALIDAKYRDEKLAEQGRTIAALQNGVEASRERLEAVGNELVECQAALNTVRETAQQTALADKTALNAATASLVKETERANRLKAEATRNFAALSGTAKLANDALSQNAIENADSGE